MNILSTYYILGTCVQCFHKSFCLILPASYWSEYYLFSLFCEETKTHTVRYIIEYYTANKRQSLDSRTVWFHNTSVSLLLKYEISDMANTHCKTGTSQAPTESPSAFLELHTSLRSSIPNPFPIRRKCIPSHGNIGRNIICNKISTNSQRKTTLNHNLEMTHSDILLHTLAITWRNFSFQWT